MLTVKPSARSRTRGIAAPRASEPSSMSPAIASATRKYKGPVPLRGAFLIKNKEGCAWSIAMILPIYRARTIEVKHNYSTRGLLVLEKVLRAVDFRDATLPLTHLTPLLPAVDAVFERWPRRLASAAERRQRHAARREEVRVDDRDSDGHDRLQRAAIPPIVPEQIESDDDRRHPA